MPRSYLGTRNRVTANRPAASAFAGEPDRPPVTRMSQFALSLPSRPEAHVPPSPVQEATGPPSPSHTGRSLKKSLYAPFLRQLPTRIPPGAAIPTAATPRASLQAQPAVDAYDHDPLRRHT